MDKKIFSILGLLVPALLLGTPVVAQTLEEHLQKGQEFYDKGEFKKAVEVFEKAVDLDPNFAPAYNSLGLSHQALGDPTPDVAWFFKVAVDIDPKYADAYSNLCRVYYEAGQYDDAQRSCLKALEINPELGAAQLSLAWVYLLGKANPAESLRYFEKVRQKIKSPIIYFGMGMAYSQMGDNARVLEMVTTLREMGDNDRADQLERGIRKNEAPPPPAQLATPPAPPKSTTKPGPSTSGSGTSSGEESSNPVSGQMRIRIRGRMNSDGVDGMPSATKPSGGQSSKDHPGSL